MNKTLSPIATQAKALRLELKAAGVSASVTSERFSMGQALNVTITGGSWAKGSAIAGKYEKLHRDSYTGETLSGGNTYLHLNVRLPEAKVLDVLYACSEACSALANCGPGAGVEIGATACTLYRGDWQNTFTVYDTRTLTRHHVGRNQASEVAEVVATILFKRG